MYAHACTPQLKLRYRFYKPKLGCCQNKKHLKAKLNKQNYWRLSSLHAKQRTHVSDFWPKPITKWCLEKDGTEVYSYIVSQEQVLTIYTLYSQRVDGIFTPVLRRECMVIWKTFWWATSVTFSSSRSFSSFPSRSMWPSESQLWVPIQC